MSWSVLFAEGSDVFALPTSIVRERQGADHFGKSAVDHEQVSVSLGQNERTVRTAGIRCARDCLRQTAVVGFGQNGVFRLRHGQGNHVG